MAPGKQCVVVLKKQIFLVIESPIMSVVGVKRVMAVSFQNSVSEQGCAVAV